MVPRRPIPAPPARHGFTLLEVLLTLCLLVVLASLTWPVLSRPMAAQRLRKAATRVQMEWVRARVKAMSDGCVYLFCYSPDSNRYFIQSQASPDSVGQDGLTGHGPTAGGMTAGGMTAGGMTAGSQSPLGGAGWMAAVQTEEGTLPEGIRFVFGETAIGSPAQAMPAQPIAAGDQTTALAIPICFYPDGITSTATVWLANEYGATIDVSLRGLTGVAAVGQVQGGGLAQGGGLVQGGGVNRP